MDADLRFFFGNKLYNETVLIHFEKGGGDFSIVSLFTIESFSSSEFSRLWTALRMAHPIPNVKKHEEGKLLERFSENLRF